MIKEKQSLHLRHELKYCISYADDLEISGRLKKIFSHDDNANSHGIYHVSSLYFDTPYDKAFRQKIDGVNSREKFRIRYYNTDLSYIRLEKKFKINGLCGKYSVKLNKTQVDAILNGEIEFLLQSNDPLLIELYSKMRGEILRPRTVVYYEREAFIYKPGNVRVTIDRNIKTNTNIRKFMEEESYFLSVAENHSVLEVKYDAYLPEIVKMAVQIPNRQIGSFSKYAVCRRYD